MDTNNFEYHKLRPKELVKRRSEQPVAYMGLGILEWHGVHNPLGLDGEKANGIALHLAERLGGVVMPPLFWGDNRKEICELVFNPAVSPWLKEATTDHTIDIMATMKLDKADFEADASRSIDNGGWRLWEELLVHILFQIQTLGFRFAVLIPGHYPLFGPLDRAITAYKSKGGLCTPIVLSDPMYSENLDAGDHAAAFETSLMLALAPHLVNLDELNPDPAVPPVGVMGQDPRKYASNEFGEKILAKMTDLVAERIKP
jgi:creatinine amidohydrolase